MRRWFFNVFAAVSLVLCIAFVVMWARSYWVRDIVIWSAVGGDSHIAQSIRGRLHLLSNLNGSSAGGGVWHSSDWLAPDVIWNGGMSDYPVRPEWHAGFIWQYYGRYHVPLVGGGAQVGQHRLVVVPYWAPAAVLAVLPAIWYWRSRGAPERRRRRGLCTTCGYDLRAHKPGERCPECGTVIAEC